MGPSKWHDDDDDDAPSDAVPGKRLLDDVDRSRVRPRRGRLESRLGQVEGVT